MMTGRHHLFGIIASTLVAISLLGCGASKNLSTSDAIKEKTSAYVLNAVRKGSLTPDFLNARAKIKFDDGSTRISFNANIRIKRDSMIWMNASVLGYEAARLLFRPDSIFMINRLEKSYIKDRYESMDSLFEVPVSFTQLQDLLLGNALLDESAPKMVDYTNEKYNIFQEVEPYTISHQIDARSYQIDHIQVSDVRSGQQLDATLESYQPIVDLGNFSYIRQYIINKDNVQLANIQINYSHVDRDRTKKTPFEIPSHYSRSD